MMSGAREVQGLLTESYSVQSQCLEFFFCVWQILRYIVSFRIIPEVTSAARFGNLADNFSPSSQTSHAFSGLRDLTHAYVCMHCALRSFENSDVKLLILSTVVNGFLPTVNSSYLCIIMVWQHSLCVGKFPLCSPILTRQYNDYTFNSQTRCLQTPAGLHTFESQKSIKCMHFSTCRLQCGL